MIAKNHCLMKLRDRQGKVPVELTDTPAEETDREALLQNDVTLDLLEEALEELNAEQQQCVTLFYLEKKSYQEISDREGYSLMQVKSHIQNGKRNLKIALEKKLKQKANR